ncbi:MAG: hypothetical protein RR824_01635 [Clostridia bacterium]
MEYGLRVLKGLMWLLLFLGCCVLVVLGQRSIGYFGLWQMLLGLGGILCCLFAYNLRHK